MQQRKMLWKSIKFNSNLTTFDNAVVTKCLLSQDVLIVLIYFFSVRRLKTDCQATLNCLFIYCCK